MMMGTAKKKCGPQMVYAQGVLDEAVQNDADQMDVSVKGLDLVSNTKINANDHATG